jgi:hypothetical protein
MEPSRFKGALATEGVKDWNIEVNCCSVGEMIVEQSAMG